MKKTTLHHILRLLAEDIYRDGGLRGHVPSWTKERGQDYLNDRKAYELQTAQSERAMVAFDEAVIAHRCVGGWRRCRHHEAYVAWPIVRQMWRDADG